MAMALEKERREGCWEVSRGCRGGVVILSRARVIRGGAVFRPDRGMLLVEQEEGMQEEGIPLEEEDIPLEEEDM